MSFGRRIEPAEYAAELEAGSTIEAVMRVRAELAKAFADPPVSGFRVGAVARGASGVLYPGANLEFRGMPLSASVHAEQAAVMNAWLNGEREIAAIAATATPCGHCRQFLVELGDPAQLAIVAGNDAPTTLAALLPAAFGGHDLGIDRRLLDGATVSLRAAIKRDDDLGRLALDAAQSSYAPYSGAYAGIALRLKGGETVIGRYAESAAYNPGVPALQCALVDLALRGIDRERIKAVVLVEAHALSSQRTITKKLLGSICSEKLHYVRAERS